MALLVVASGCGGAASTAPPPARGTDTSVLAQPPADPDDVRLELLNAGAEPRAPLRYDFRAVRAEKTVVDMKMDISGVPTDDRVGEAWVAQPTTRVSSLVEPRQLTPEGDLVYRVVHERADILKDASVDSEVRAQMEAQVKPIVGLPSQATVTPRGIAKRVDVLVPSGASPDHSPTIDALRSEMRQWLTPFPADAVGVGAKWQTTLTVQAKEFRLVEVTTYTLVSRQKSMAVIDFEFDERSPGPQKLTDRRPGSSMTLESHQGHGSGRVTIDFDRLVVHGEKQCERRGCVTLERNGEKFSMSKAFRLKYKFEPLASGATPGSASP